MAMPTPMPMARYAALPSANQSVTPIATPSRR
jgi:hypothetical protein